MDERTKDDFEFLPYPDFKSMDINQSVVACTNYLDYLKDLYPKIVYTSNEIEHEKLWGRIQKQVRKNLNHVY